MALTVTLDGFPRLLGNRRVVTGSVTFDASYPTGGESITLIQLGLSALQNLDVTNSASEGAFVIAWNKDVNDPVLSAFMGDNNNASDGPFIEVADTTDLSALVCRFEATGW